MHSSAEWQFDKGLVKAGQPGTCSLKFCFFGEERNFGRYTTSITIGYLFRQLIKYLNLASNPTRQSRIREDWSRVTKHNLSQSSDSAKYSRPPPRSPPASLRFSNPHEKCIGTFLLLRKIKSPA
jgi:hypothetical protein